MSSQAIFLLNGKKEIAQRNKRTTNRFLLTLQFYFKYVLVIPEAKYVVCLFKIFPVLFLTMYIKTYLT